MITAHTPLRGTMVFDPPVATTGQCGESLFPGQLPPNCELTPTGATLTCK